MKSFEPSPSFVSRVMAGVRAYEAARSAVPARVRQILSLRSVRCALTVGGGLAGAINIVRIWLAVFAPALCR